ncbi:MAG: calcineurin, partial [bacterium]|nr:calcineurin [bacterium]
RYVTVEGFTDFLENPPADDSLVSPQQVVDGVGARILAMRPGGEVALRMSDRNVITIVGKTAFVHGGILPHVVEYGIERLNEETRSWMRGEVDCPPPVLFGWNGPVWSRHYSAEPDETDCLMLEGVLKSLKVKRLVVGHTVQKEGIASACEEHVWRIDVGMAEHYGGSPEVLEIRRNKVRRIMAETEE